jgi:hypothetical protein
MKLRNLGFLVVICGFALVARAGTAGSKFEGNWNTKMSCDAHGEMPAYSWDFPSTIKDGVYHGQHSEEGSPGYLVVDGGPIGDDGNVKLSAKGKVQHSQAHGVFAIKGNNYSYNIDAHFEGDKGTGTREKGAGVLGRPCTFEFTRQSGDAPAPVLN